MISVLIPVYNVSRLLPRCLDSLISQTYPDWEAVCVDDGSTDGSAAILDEYAIKDNRIKVFHTANHGASFARNYALDLINGDYLMMVDSDDSIHHQTFEICISQFNKYGSDAVMFTYSRAYRTRMMLRQMLQLSDTLTKRSDFDIDNISVLNSDDIFAYATEYSHPDDINPQWAVKHCQPWRGVFRTAPVRDVRFIEGIIYEDFPWWSEVMLRLQKVSIINLPLYFYYPNFKGYIMSSSQDYRINSLKTAISYIEKVYAAKATPHQLALWEAHFLAPFKDKLERKMAKCK